MLLINPINLALKNYSDYDLVDFLSDDSFVEWATGKSLENQNFWTLWPGQYPHKAEVYYQSLEIVSNLKIEPISGLTDWELSQLLTQISNKTIYAGGPDRKINWYQQRWLRVAASILLISTIGFWTYFRVNATKEEAFSKIPIKDHEVVLTEPGVIRLPDNSMVILKPRSKLTYSSAFKKETRDVYLEGEAFFEVSKDENKPFIVHADELITKVLGTSFSVRAYKKDKEYQVTVNTGKVSVFTKHDTSGYSINSGSLTSIGKGILVKPNQQATFYRKQTKLVKTKLDRPTALSAELADGSLNFQETPFSEVVKVLNQAYAINISYDKNLMANCPLTASLSSQHLYEKLDLICQALEAHYEIINGVIVIKGNGGCNKQIVN